jgi:hypothetical protein
VNTISAASIAAVLLAIALPAARADSPLGITNGVAFEHARRDLPLQIAGVTFGDDDLKVIVVNLTDRKVVQVTVGALLTDETSPAPVTRVGEPCRTSLGRGGALLVVGAHAGFAAVDSYFRGKGMNKRIVSIGIVHVRFADGGEWSLPLDAPGRFERDNDEALQKRVNELSKALRGSDPTGVSLFSKPPQQRGELREIG